MEGVTIPIPAAAPLAEEEAEEWRAGTASPLPHGRGTVRPQQGESMRGLVALTTHWVICRLERPTASGVTCRCYPAHEVERVDFDDA